MTQQHTVRIPGGCQHVINAMRGDMGQTYYTSMTGWWRIIDLQTATGKSSSDVRIRQLRRAVPGLVEMKKLTEKGTTFCVYRLNPKFPPPTPTVADRIANTSIDPEKVTGDLCGVV